MKVNNKQKRHKRHDETMSAVVYIYKVSDIYTQIHGSLPFCMLNLFRIFYFFFFCYYCFLIVYTKIFVVYLHKIACTSYINFTLNCTCVFTSPLPHNLASFSLFLSSIFPVLPCGCQPGKQRNQMNNCKLCWL